MARMYIKPVLELSAFPGYHEEGAEVALAGSVSKRARRKFTAEFKVSTMALLRKGKKSICELAKDPGLPATSIRNWVRWADVDKGAAWWGR